MKIVSGEFCGNCKFVKNTLKGKGYIFEEIDVMSSKGREIVDKTQLKSLPIIIDEGKFMAGEDAVNFAQKAVKR